MKQVTIYSTPTCGWCDTAKQFFRENAIAYSEKNVAQDQNALKEMVEKSGQMGVPVIDVEGEVMIGFNKPKLESLLVTV